MTLPVYWEKAIRDCVEQYPLAHDPKLSHLAYGTSGFRTIGSLLPPVAARVAFVSVLRVWWALEKNASSNHGSSVGCMFTASHNPGKDNGLKLIDTDGGMLATPWEATCTAAANAATAEELLNVLTRWIEAEHIKVPTEEHLAAGCPFGAVHLTRDTRITGISIQQAFQASLHAVNIPFNDHGMNTTPLLHFMVNRANQPSTIAEFANPADFGPTLYWREVLGAFGQLLRLVAPPLAEGETRKRRRLVVDAANGIGALGLRSFCHYAHVWSNPLEEFFEIIILNDDVTNGDALNFNCGSDYTQHVQTMCDTVKEWSAVHEPHQKSGCADDEIHYYSIDGDADRVVAFLHEDDKWQIIDGDRMSILFSMALLHWIGEDSIKELDVGVVQTAYANGASTDYLERVLKTRVYSTATGVKHLHRVAHERDIGVYFESNGHGTVLFKAHAISEKVLSSATKLDQTTRSIIAALPGLFSQVCGDAIADMFACEICLMAQKMSFASWSRLYTDLPYASGVVRVKNPKIITNTPDERRALTPPGMQEAIDKAVEKARATGLARAFVRPSGTEPIVRVYSEAADAKACKELAADVEEAVRTFCDKP